jgi:hypothetical protein
MTNGENISTPSTYELKNLLSVEGDDSSIADELTYTALGMYDEDDYVRLAQICLDFGAVKEVAKAEARLRHIEEFDRRKPTVIAENNGLIHIRKTGIGKLFETLTYDQKREFVEVIANETELLEVEEVDAGRIPETE